MNAVVEAVRDRIKCQPASRDLADRSFRACPPCDSRTITSAESELHFRLPDTLRAIYESVANGGFGPGYGVMGLAGGFTDDLGNTVVSLYKAYCEPDPDDPSWSWREGHLPFCHWGCGVYSVVECLTPGNPVLFVDPSARDEGATIDSVTRPHKASFDDWIRDWLSGKDLWAEVWGKDG
jgi:hypothetical protein